MKKNASSTLIGDEGDGGHVEELRQHLHDILREHLSQASATTKSTLLRCVLVHSDLNEMNILINKEGTITGIVDWEYHTLQPAVLAAGYPPWLSYDACSDPRFANPQQFWLENPKESMRLRNLYFQIVKSRDQGYFNALKLELGATLRSCVSWLLTMSSNPGCKRMKEWMDVTFTPAVTT